MSHDHHLAFSSSCKLLAALTDANPKLDVPVPLARATSASPANEDPTLILQDPKGAARDFQEEETDIPCSQVTGADLQELHQSGHVTRHRAPSS